MSAQQLQIGGLRFDFDAPVVSIAARDADFVYMLGSGAFCIVSEEGATARKGHSGVSLAHVVLADGAVLSGGDDGEVLRILPDGTVSVFASLGRDWPNALAYARDTDLVAIAAGRYVEVHKSTGDRLARFEHPSTAGGVAFDPRGKRLAVSHYGGASVWMAANPASQRRQLAWKGSHLGVMWSPCGRFIVTTMQENAVHGWRIEDSQHFRMDGYPTRVRSLAWVDRGKKLATTGAGPNILLWPFIGPKGPMGKSAEVIGAANEAPVMIVASRPGPPTLAAGYSDGSIQLHVISPTAGYTLAPAASAPISALAWSPRGDVLAFGREDGSAGVIRLSDAARSSG